MSAARRTRPNGVMAAPQDFESSLLGGPVFRLDMQKGWSLEELRSRVQECLSSGAILVSSRVPASDVDAIQALASQGFRDIEELVTLERPLPSTTAPWPEGVRAAGDADADSCREIARTAFRYDRFHADPNVDDGTANAVKAAWVTNGLRGRADSLWVRDDDTSVAGFVLCMRSGATAVIDLIAVAPGCTGKGHGRALLDAATAHYGGRCRVLRVGTQTTNEPSLALYRKAGFREVARARTFHLTPQDT